MNTKTTEALRNELEDCKNDLFTFHKRGKEFMETTRREVQLMKDDFNSTVQKIPILGDIPLIKHAFRTYKDEKRKTELLIFLTPFVVESDEEGGTLTEKVRERYRGAVGFVENRDRSLLYDDLNREKDQLTIYDDWRTFEKKVEFAENYFNPEAAERAAEKSRIRSSSRYFMKDLEHPVDDQPYEGEILIPKEQDDIQDNESQEEEKDEPSDSSAPVNGSSLPLSDLMARERLLVERAETINK